MLQCVAECCRVLQCVAVKVQIFEIQTCILKSQRTTRMDYVKGLHSWLLGDLTWLLRNLICIVENLASTETFMSMVIKFRGNWSRIFFTTLRWSEIFSATRVHLKIVRLKKFPIFSNFEKIGLNFSIPHWDGLQFSLPHLYIENTVLHLSFTTLSLYRDIDVNVSIATLALRSQCQFLNVNVSANFYHTQSVLWDWDIHAVETLT